MNSAAFWMEHGTQPTPSAKPLPRLPSDTGSGALNGPDSYTIRKTDTKSSPSGLLFAYAEKEKNEYDTP